MVRHFYALVIAMLVLGFTGVPSIRTFETRAFQTRSPLESDLPEGIAVEVLAEGTVEVLPASPLQLVLERMDIGADTYSDLRKSPGPEIYVVESGTAVITDDLGIQASYPGGTGLFVPQDALFTLNSDGELTTKILRLAVTSSNLGNEGSSNTSYGENAEVLVSTEIISQPDRPVRLFVARATWKPGALVEGRIFSGPVGIVGEVGELSVTGRSGVQGQLPAEKALVVPEDTAVRLENTSDEPVTVLLFGLIPFESPLYRELPKPTPTPTLAPTETPTPEPPTPTPTSTPLPATGSILFEADELTGFDEWDLGGGWLTFEGKLLNDGGGGSVIVPYESGSLANYAVEVELRMVDLGNNSGVVGGPADLGFSLWMRGGDLGVRVYPSWSAYAFENSYLFVNVKGDQQYDSSEGSDLNEWHVFRLEIDGNRAFVSNDGQPYFSDDDNRLLRVAGSEIGIAIDKTFQVEIASVRVISGDNGGGDRESVASETEVDSESGNSGGASSIADRLPNENEIPNGLIQIGEGKRTSDEITSTFPDPAEADRLFEEWRWRSNTYREFGTAEGGIVATNQTNYIDVSIHRFGTVDGATEALFYFAQARQILLGLSEIEIDPISDDSLAISGTYSGTNEATVYFRKGGVVVRVTALSPSGNPLNDAIAVARVVAAK